MATKHAGLALMAGVVLTTVATLFMPGNAIVYPVDQTDFALALGALSDAPILAQWMTFLTLVSLLLMSFGLLGLYPLASRQPGLGGRLLQFGIIASVIEWTALVVAAGMRHFVIHLLQRGDLPTTGSQTAMDFEATAFAVFISTTAVTLTFAALFPLGSGLTGLGLLGRFTSMNLFKVSSYGLAVAGLVGLVIYLVALNAPDIDIRTLFTINSVALYIGAICLFIVGLGMYQGRKELAEDGSS